MTPEDLEFLSERDDVVEIKTVKKYDTLKDREIQVSKIIVTDPLAIGGTQTTQSIRNVVESWESDIKYYENYLYDNSLIIGKYYKIENDKIIPHDFEMSDETRLAMKSLLWDKLANTGMTDTKQFQEEVSNWAELLNQPIPKIKRISLDIEVETDGRLPDAKIADKKVTAVGFEGSDGIKRVFVLKRDGIEEGVNDLDKNIEVAFNEIQSKVSQVARRLPKDIVPPVVRKVETNASAIMWLSLTGNRTIQQLNLYASNILKKKIETIDGVGEIRLGGKRDRTLRINLLPEKMAALKISAEDLITAFNNEHIQFPGGFLVRSKSEKMLLKFLTASSFL